MKNEDNTIKVVDKSGNVLAQDENPAFLGTKPIKLPGVPGRGKRKTVVPIQMFLPPGVSRFFMERLDASHVRFIIATDEVERLAEKAEKMMTDTAMKDGSNVSN